MRADLYIRVVLTIVAAALVYLCVIFTPLPTASAQTGRVVGARTPGEYTGPAEVVIVGWRFPEGGSLPVHVTRGDVRVLNEVRVAGQVEAVQPHNGSLRTVLIGYEQAASTSAPGRFNDLSPTVGRGVPVVPLQPRP